MPARVGEILRRGDLFQRFLNAVFAEVAMAGGVGLADRVDGEGLGDGDEPD
jgi:hypothetical protein